MKAGTTEVEMQSDEVRMRATSAAEDESMRLTTVSVTSNDEELVRMWTVWKGKNLFLFDGRIITGPERCPFLGTVAMVFVPMVLYFGFIVPPLLNDLDPGAWWAPLFGVLGFGAIYYSLVSAHCTDPGIIPREPKRARYVPRIISKVVSEGEKPVRMRFCDTCHIYRPPRCHHCSDCGNCVEVFDHHCPWIGNCVARRNYRYFVGFLLNTSMSLIFVFSTSLHLLILAIKEKGNPVDGLMMSPVSLVLMIYTLLIFLPVSCLTGYHGVIISQGETTKEEVKRLYKDTDNPNDRGCVNNWYITLCVKAQESKLTKLRDLVSPAYLDDDIPDDDEDEPSVSSFDGRAGIESNPLSATQDEVHTPERKERPSTGELEGHFTPSHLVSTEDAQPEFMDSVDTTKAGTADSPGSDSGSLVSSDMDETEGVSHLVETVTMTPSREGFEGVAQDNKMME